MTKELENLIQATLEDGVLEDYEKAALVKERGLAYKARKNYKNGDVYGGPLSRKGEKAYEQQAQIMGYQQISLRDKNNFNKGFSYLAKEGTARYNRLYRLDMMNVDASDRLKAEQARGERIEYENAEGFNKRMQDAVNAHMDAMHSKLASGKDNPEYKRHFNQGSPEELAAMAKYNAVSKISAVRSRGSFQDFFRIHRADRFPRVYDGGKSLCG